MDPKILHWSYRDFHEFPQQMLDEAEQLEEIYLKENFIPSLPIWLFEFTYLKFIQLSGNLLSVLPAEINQLKHLEHLDVSKNTLTELPITLTHLNKLQHLNVSENEIDTVHKDFGRMKSLESLLLSKNRLRNIPMELSRCATMTELVLSDNNVKEIPTKIMLMANLRVLEAERCCLQYLPGMIGTALKHIRVFNNTRLTHYPLVYERFLRLHYDYWSENVVSADQLMIFLPDESKRTILPRGIRTVHLHAQPRRPGRLLELGLRSLYGAASFYERVCINLPAGILPHDIHQALINGPVCRCGNPQCQAPLFTECHFVLLKKNRSLSHIIFSIMFCSKDCSFKWQNDNRQVYHSIDWTRLV